MILIDGKKIADEYRKKLKDEIQELPSVPGFAAIRIGEDANILINCLQMFINI